MFRLLVEGVTDYAIFMLDVNGYVATWNLGAQRIKGYTAEEIIGQHFSRFYPQDAIDSGWPEHELAVATEQGRFAEDGWRLRKDGSRFWANVVITALRDESGTLRGFAKLTRDLSERQRTEALEVAHQQREEIFEAERSARMNAQRAARIKDEFLATLSHELRTPLSAILGWTQILARGRDTLKMDDVLRGVDVIDRNARAQVQLIDDLLDLNRIMTGTIRLELQQVAVHDVILKAIESAEPAAQAKEIKLKTILEPLSANVSADPARLQQVVWNLVTNAIKFTPRGGQVQILLQRVNSHLELSVSDTGMGIPAHFLPLVFDRFSQEDSSTTRQYGGLGLGLAICKQLVELHGGSIRATSQGEGQGATFFVNLPVSILQLETESAQRIHPTTPSTGAAMVLPDLQGLRILVVDDEHDARDLLQRIFEAQAALVVTAASGGEALRSLK
ncbi:MAG TPA: ATP-binding protein, partial [Burkholderiaceae bacterium]|nr:ATP-binding protein [Burkholderiaceae bacterium]